MDGCVKILQWNHTSYKVHH